MSTRPLWKYLPPPGLTIILWLTTLGLLSGLLYYRAVNIQRYLEPVLGIFEPRIEFAKNIDLAFRNEFGPETVNGLNVISTSIFVEKSLLFSGDGDLKDPAEVIYKKLSRVFLALMKDSQMRSKIRAIQVTVRFSSNGAKDRDRMKAQQMVGIIQDSLLRAEPELGGRYRSYFEVSAKPLHEYGDNSELVELRIIPSELLYTEVLQRLVKYAR